MTTITGAKSFVPEQWSTHEWTGDKYGRVLHFGIREHAMGSILNGIVLHGNTRAFGGTFLIFSDYMRPAVRLAALMGIPSIFVWTHDSVALGEDGPTHQPIEQIATLRAIPNLDIVRPADANETSFAWKAVLERRKGPAGLALSRQNLPVYPRGEADSTGAIYAPAEHTAKGAYTLLEAGNGKPEVILIATGSEVEIAVNARLELEAKGVATRVVSAPCLEWFDEQPEAYREAVLPASVKARVSVEAGLALGWSKYIGSHGQSVSIEHFGASADPKTLYREFGMTVEAVVAAADKSRSSI
jgi:transketolase